MSPLDDISDWETPCEYEGSVCDSGYGEESIASNSDWSVCHFCSSGTCINKDCEKAVTSFPSSSEYDPKVLIGPTTDFPALEKDLHIRPAKKSVFIREDGETIYGRLFEDPDPWRRIGIILGLEKDDDAVQSPPGDGNNIQFDMTPDVEPKKRKINDPDDDRVSTSSVVPESEWEDRVSETAQDIGSDDSEGARSCGDKSMSLLFGTTSFLTEHFRHDESGTNREGSPEVLAMPQLQVVNGKFLAPSIFLDDFEWEESEEE